MEDLDAYFESVLVIGFFEPLFELVELLSARIDEHILIGDRLPDNLA